MNIGLVGSGDLTKKAEFSIPVSVQYMVIAEVNKYEESSVKGM